MTDPCQIPAEDGLPGLDEYLPTSERWTTPIVMDVMQRYARDAIAAERERKVKELVETENGEIARITSELSALRQQLAEVVRDAERLRALLIRCEPAVFDAHMANLGTRVARPDTLLAQVREAIHP